MRICVHLRLTKIYENRSHHRGRFGRGPDGWWALQFQRRSLQESQLPERGASLRSKPSTHSRSNAPRSARAAVFGRGFQWDCVLQPKVGARAPTLGNRQSDNPTATRLRPPGFVPPEPAPTPLESSAKVAFSKTERGSVTRSGLICKAACCGSQSRAPFLQRSPLG
jgi:hypothetical protein